MAHTTFTQAGMSFYHADFTTLNNSGATGRVLAFVDQNAKEVTFDIRAVGMEAGQVHPAHVHGFADDSEAMSPTIVRDTDTDGFVELAEGVPSYGPVQLNLTTQPGDAMQLTGMGATFPTADANGMLSYKQTFSFANLGMEGASALEAISPLEAKEIVLHGLTLATSQGKNGGEADGTAGYKAVLPVVSGELHAISAAGDVVEAVAALGLNKSTVLNRDAIAQQVVDDFEATGQWFLREEHSDFDMFSTMGAKSGDEFLRDGFQLYETSFVTLNNSGVTGRVLALVNEDAQTVTFDIKAMGLEAGQVHPAHVHGFSDDMDAKTPTIAFDTDSDGFVELAEGVPAYGPVQLNLTTQPGDAMQLTGMGAMFPAADASGMLSYRQTFSFADLGKAGMDVFDAIAPLGAKEIVLHGISLADGQGGGSGEADGTAGYKAVLPVASGELRTVMGAQGVVEAIGTMDLYSAGAINWEAVVADYAANPPATSTWFL